MLVTGLAADRFNRRFIMAGCLALEALCALGLLLFTLSNPTVVTPVFGILVVLGIARAFMNPASDALAPNLVPKEAIAHAISLTTMIWQTANIAGPVAGGLLYGIAGEVAYGVALALVRGSGRAGARRSAGCRRPTMRATRRRLARCSRASPSSARKRSCWARSRSICSRCCWAVPWRCCRSMRATSWRWGPGGSACCAPRPGWGPSSMALYLARYGIRDRAGVILFAFVAAFGFFTMVFGLSTSVPLSIAALVLMGACDMVSVYIRETLLQLWTPDEVRGRVNAVNRVFIGASNELGEFRAGVVARAGSGPWRRWRWAVPEPWRWPGSGRAGSRNSAPRGGWTGGARAAICTSIMAGTDKTKNQVLGPAPIAVLVNPQLGENIGTAARAMANFGLHELRLLDPRDGWPNEKALDHLVRRALDYRQGDRALDHGSALKDVNYVYATTARPRGMVKEVITPEQAGDDMRAAHRPGREGGDSLRARTHGPFE